MINNFINSIMYKYEERSNWNFFQVQYFTVALGKYLAYAFYTKEIL
jgi:hypothetical protein